MLFSRDSAFENFIFSLQNRVRDTKKIKIIQGEKKKMYQKLINSLNTLMHGTSKNAL